jgi:hypothetical protein
MAGPSGRKPDPKSTGKAPAVDKKTTGPRPAIGARTPTGRAPAVTGTNPAIKAPSGKAAAIGGKAASGKAAPVRATSSRKVAPMPAGGGLRPKGSIRLTCRECLEEWTVDPARAQSAETIACPVCEHRAQPPSDDILHQIALYKGIEGGNLRLAIVSLVVGLGAMAAWTILTATPTAAEQPGIFYGPILVAVIGLIGAVVFGVKYEKSRWETYF